MIERLSLWFRNVVEPTNNKIYQFTKLERKVIQVKRRLDDVYGEISSVKRDIDSFTDGAIASYYMVTSEEDRILEFTKRLENCHIDKRDYWKALIHMARSAKIGHEQHRDNCLKIVDELKYKLLELKEKKDRLKSDLIDYKRELNPPLIIHKGE